MYVIMPADAKVGVVTVEVTNNTARPRLDRQDRVRGPSLSAEIGLPWRAPREAGLFWPWYHPRAVQLTAFSFNV